MRPPSIPDNAMPANISPSAARRGRLGCSGTSVATPPRLIVMRSSAVSVQRETCGVREWIVAGGLVETPQGLLLVRNQRRGGFEDWSTPGGVIDDEDGSVLDGLTREVEEETGLRVTRWEGPLYEVEAVAPDLGWIMRCEVHRAVDFEGEVQVADPDGIVVEAAFVTAAD